MYNDRIIKLWQKGNYVPMVKQGSFGQLACHFALDCRVDGVAIHVRLRLLWEHSEQQEADFPPAF